MIYPLFMGRKTGRDSKATETDGVSETRFAKSDDFRTALVAALPRLRRFAIALVGDIATADDLLQDCAERALRSAHMLKDASHVFGWLRSILYNMYIDNLRARRRRGTAVDLDELANSLALSAPSADRSSTLEFVRAMSLLSVEHRQILLLAGLEGLSYREIAEEIHLPMGTVMSRLARAREQLRTALEAMEGSEKLPPQTGRTAGNAGS